MNSPIPNIRAVLFDAGGTLLRAYPSVGHVYATEAERFGVSVTPETLSRHFGVAWRRLRPQENHDSPFRTSEAHERAWWRSLVEAVFDDAGLRDAFERNFDAFFDALYDRFESPEVWHVFDDVVPALDAIDAAGIRMAVVSNWDSRLPRLLKAIGLAERFEFILTSAEAGWSKPHCAIFEAALERLSLPGHQVLNVGDGMEEDVRGAIAAGLHGIYLNRNAESAESISTLTDLMKRISRPVKAEET
jgi:putative hydrolase of the HAD superfamily